jgi:hypothetical protein
VTVGDPRGLGRGVCGGDGGGGGAGVRKEWQGVHLQQQAELDVLAVHWWVGGIEQCEGAGCMR